MRETRMKNLALLFSAYNGRMITDLVAHGVLIPAYSTTTELLIGFYYTSTPPKGFYIHIHTDIYFIILPFTFLKHPFIYIHDVSSHRVIYYLQPLGIFIYTKSLIRSGCDAAVSERNKKNVGKKKK